MLLPPGSRPIPAGPGIRGMGAGGEAVDSAQAQAPEVFILGLRVLNFSVEGTGGMDLGPLKFHHSYI